MLVPAITADRGIGANLGHAWLCGESAIATGLRCQLARERGVDRRRVLVSGYWRVGAARE